jgi:hypothetical protein
MIYMINPPFLKSYNPRHWKMNKKDEKERLK